MATSSVSEILVKFRDEGANTVGAAFKRITREARGVEKSFQKLSDQGVRDLRVELDKLKSSGMNTIASMKAQKNALLALRDMADVTGNEFKQLTAEINRVDAALAKTSKNKGAKGAIGGVAKTFGAIAGAGIYGGVEGLAGAGIGAFFGPGGAIAGGVIGAQIGMARQGLEEIAVYNAALGRQRKALQLVIGDTDKYKISQQFLADTSERLAIPQDVITRQFTSLTASVVGAGHSVQDAQDVFLSITSGIRGTGGSIEDMNAALRATSQVFSKGKVSAEELRQQLGERLPGAFTLFAASMGLVPADLDKALEQGKVTLQDFMGFSKHLFAEYGENAAILSKAPEAAGDRLAVEIAKLKVTFGGLFTNIGAAFQDNTTKILKFLNENQQAIKLFVVDIANFADKTVKIFVILADAFKNFVVNVFKNFGDEIKFVFSTQIMMINLYIKALNAFRKLIGKSAVESLDFAKDIQAILDADPRFTADNLFSTGTDFQDLIDKLNKQKKDAEGGNTGGGGNDKNYEGVMGGIKDYFDSIKKGAEEVRAVVTGAFQKMEDAIVNFVMTGKLNFAEFTRSILADMARIIVRQAILKPLLGGIFKFGDGGVASGAASGGEVTMASFTNAMGNVYGRNGIQKFARGGVVHSPQIFPFKNGIGLMGEAGSEAILPLKRTKQGKLGVESSGGGGNVVNVSVNAGGTSAQGNTMKANQLGKMIGTAIEAELIKQKRPGGILYT